MIIGIYDEKNKGGNYYLTLLEEYNSFALKAVDEDGEWLTTVLRIGKGRNSCITLNEDVSAKLGLELDEDGCVVTKKEGE